MKHIFGISHEEAAEMIATLSPCEIAVMQLVAFGCSSKEIGDELGKSSRTVDVQKDAIRKKIGLPARAFARVWYAWRVPLAQNINVIVPLDLSKFKPRMIGIGKT